MLTVYDVAEGALIKRDASAVTKAAVGFACSSKVSTDIPDQVVSNFDQLVTQWMSTVISSRGSA